MNKNNPIGILDSGIGGLTVLREVQKLMPNENIIYIGDSKRVPYGNKPIDEIIFLANKLIAFLENNNAKAILLACNTISSQIANLKSNVMLFSVIEAGCICTKNTALSSDIGLIATKATIMSKAYEKTFERLGLNYNVFGNYSTALPNTIDHNIKGNYLKNLIKECVEPILCQKPNIKDLILGCTHFPIITPELKELYPNMNLIDPALEQALELKEYLYLNNMFNNSKNKGTTSIFTTGNPNGFLIAKDNLNITFNKILKVPLLEEDKIND